MIHPRLLLFLLLFPIACSYAANITWSPETGYQSDELELSGLLPEEIQKVLKWMNDGRRAEEKRNFSAAHKRYKRVSKRFPKSQYAPEALFRTAQIRLKQNKIDQAFAAFESIAWVYPNYGSFNETIGEMYKIAVSRLTHRDKILWVAPGFKNTDRAVTHFERIVYLAPYSDYAPLSLMNIAQVWDKKGNENMTIYALDRMVTNYPNNMLSADAYLKLAQTHAEQIRGPYYDQGSTENAITFFRDFLIQYPENNNVSQAEVGLAQAEDVKALSKMKIADFYYNKRANYKAARVLYNEAITIAPRSATAERSRMKLDEIQKKIGDETYIEKQERKAPSQEELEQKAEQRARKKVLGIF